VGHRAPWECRIYRGKAKERQHLNDLGVDGKVRWHWILKERDVMTWTSFMYLRSGTSVSSEFSGSIKCGEFRKSWGDTSFPRRTLFHFICLLVS
jgi:hypothetical protein